VLPLLDVRQPLRDGYAAGVPEGDVVAERVLGRHDLPEFCRQVAPELLDRRLVGLLECEQGRPPVVLRPDRVEQYPDPQVPRLDSRVVAVL
jgi:hypothetical protein